MERIEHLLVSVRGWLARDPKLALSDRSYVVEDVLGRYEAPGIEIVHDGAPVATVEPLAAAVIGAQGRLDVKGPLDEVPWSISNPPGEWKRVVPAAASFSCGPCSAESKGRLVLDHWVEDT